MPRPQGYEPGSNRLSYRAILLSPPTKILDKSLEVWTFYKGPLIWERKLTFCVLFSQISKGPNYSIFLVLYSKKSGIFLL